MQRSGRTGLGAVGVALAVPLPSLPVFQPVGCWGVLPCAIASLLERLPFLPAGVFRLAVLPVLALGCGPWLPLPSGDRLLSFGSGVASAGSWSPLGVCGVALLRLARAFFYICYKRLSEGVLWHNYLFLITLSVFTI